MIGHSMGGAVVQKVMNADTDRIAAVALLAAMVPGLLSALEKLLLLRKPGSLLALQRLLAGGSLSPAQINRLPFFAGQLSESQARSASQWLQAESEKALGELGCLYHPGGTQPFPLLVIGSRQDYLFGAGPLRRTAAHSETIILEQGCHDRMLDPDWASSATRISRCLDEHVL